MTEPLTPPECDLTDFQFMPLDVLRLRDSELASNESPEACWAAVLLWAASWHQVPAASVPNDDKWLAKAAGYGRVVKEWLRVKAGAMRGFVECSDGRLYHAVVAEKAREAWKAKLEQRWRTECARIKKHNERHGTACQRPAFDEWMSLGCPQGQHLPVADETSSKGQGEGQGQGDSSEAKASADAAAPAAVANAETPEDRRARRMAWLSKHGVTDPGEARAFMNTVAKDWGGAVAAEAFETAMASDGPFGDPKALVIGCAKNLTEHTRAIHAHANTVPSGAAEKTAEYLAERAAIVGAPPPAGLKSIRAAIAGAGLHTPEVAA